MSDSHDVRVVREHFEGHRIDVFARLILREMKLYQFRLLEREAIDWVGVMIHQPSQNVLMVEDEALRSTHRRGERLQTEGAEVEG